MIRHLKAIFRGGMFIPQEPCHLPEETSVDLTVEQLPRRQPVITSPSARQEILIRLIERMKENPIPEAAPHFTRDELHERG